MRKILPIAVAALAFAAAPAHAFDPDTPVGEAAETFPVVLIGEASSSIARAFGAAFDLSAEQADEYVTTRRIEGRRYYFSPVALHVVDESNNVWALLSTGSLDGAGHGDGGINAVHYLQASPTGWQRKGEWLNLGATGTVGNAATSWAFTGLLGRNPYLVTSGGGVWQGCALSISTLTELTPGGPVDRGSFTDGMGSGAGIGQTEQSYEGQIVAAEPDKSFSVGYTGTRSLTQRYVLKDGAYELVGKDQIPGC